MEQYNVTGMSCAACQARVEKAVSAVSGVESCSVNLLTNSMGVEGTASPDEIISAVEKAGYGASLKGRASKAEGKNGNDDSTGYDNSTKNRLIASVILLIPLMYVSMGHMLWNFPLPPFMTGNHVAMGLYELLLSALIMVINQKFFINGFRGIIHKSPNMDTLVALGASASFLYSVYALFAMTGAVAGGDHELMMYYMDQFYFESAATILTLITVGKMLEAKAKGKTTNALKALMKLAPKTAVILVDGSEKTVPIEQVKVGNKFVVRPGDSIPVDGVVIEGSSAVNEAALTGESIPAEKTVGDIVSAATINQSGFMVCEATRVGEDTTLSGIIKMVSDAAATKAPITKIADKVSGVFVPVVIGIALVTFIVWMLVGQTAGYAIARAVSVLVISCPCALGLATPVAIMVGNGVAAQSGILFKTAASLEMAGKTQIVALDKTGTITTGVMKTTDVIPVDGSLEELLQVAYSLEEKSEHPISKAICDHSKNAETKLVCVEEFVVNPGNGLQGKIGGELAAGGNEEFIFKLIAGTDESVKSSNAIDKVKDKIATLSAEGKTPVLFAKGNTLLGIIAVSDTIKEDSAKAITRLKEMGMQVVMLTGDNEITANAIAQKVGVDRVIASVKPDGKEAVVRQLMEQGKVAMVGDGINDAPALTRADQGIAIGAGTDIAIDAADIVLMKNSIYDVAEAIRISRATLRNIHENLFWAFFYNIIGIPLAAGCYVAAFGWTLNPMFGAAAMGLSSFCVVSNALRLNFLRKKEGKKEYNLEKVSEKVKEGRKSKMKITVKGMMCTHCEKHVKEALEAIDGVESAVASHDDNLVTITTTKDVDEAVIKKAVVDAGY